MTTNQIDLTLVCGARPQLLLRTLESFSDKVFQNFAVGQVIVNIDQVFGGAEQAEECCSIILKRFPNAQIFRPQTASFGAAVKRLWMATDTRHVLHLEDDWEILHEVGPEDLAPLSAPDVGMLQLAIETREKYGDEFLYITKRKRILGFEIYSRRVNAYGTSPRFIKSGLCKRYGELLKPNFDPEKQVYKNKNKKLSTAHEAWKCRILYGPNGGKLINDLGRDWRTVRKIKKVDYRGKSKWVSDE